MHCVAASKPAALSSYSGSRRMAAVPPNLPARLAHLQVAQARSLRASTANDRDTGGPPIKSDDQRTLPLQSSPLFFGGVTTTASPTILHFFSLFPSFLKIINLHSSLFLQRQLSSSNHTQWLPLLLLAALPARTPSSLVLPGSSTPPLQLQGPFRFANIEFFPVVSVSRLPSSSPRRVPALSSLTSPSLLSRRPLLRSSSWCPTPASRPPYVHLALCAYPNTAATNVSSPLL